MSVDIFVSVAEKSFKAQYVCESSYKTPAISLHSSDVIIISAFSFIAHLCPEQNFVPETV